MNCGVFLESTHIGLGNHGLLVDRVHPRKPHFGLVHMDFGQNPPRSGGPNRPPIAANLLEIARNERFRPLAVPGYPGIHLGPRGCRERDDSRS